MTDTRHRSVNWTLHPNPDGNVSTDYVQLALLMDLRDELQALNRVVGCQNAAEIPSLLRKILRAVTPKPRPRRKRGRRG